MFKNRFIALCEKNKVTPTAVCRSIGLSNAAFSSWTDETVPRAVTLKKISDYFGVEPGYFTGETDEAVLSPTEHELALLRAYRAKPELQAGIDKLLGIASDEYVCLYAAAHSEDDRPDEVIRMTKEQWERIVNAPKTNQTLL